MCWPSLDTHLVQEALHIASLSPLVRPDCSGLVCTIISCRDCQDAAPAYVALHITWSWRIAWHKSSAWKRKWTVGPAAAGEFGTTFTSSDDMAWLHDFTEWKNNNAPANDGLHDNVNSYFYWQDPPSPSHTLLSCSVQMLPHRSLAHLTVCPCNTKILSPMALATACHDILSSRQPSQQRSGYLTVRMSPSSAELSGRAAHDMEESRQHLQSRAVR